MVVADARNATRRHNIRLVKELGSSTPKASHLEHDLRATDRDTESSDVVRVATEVSDVLLYPLERLCGIPSAQIGDTTFMLVRWSVRETRAVVVGDEDKVLRQVEQTPGGILR